MAILHPFHKSIGESLSTQLPTEYTLLRDPACGGINHLSLFTSCAKTNATKSCDVDMLILSEQKLWAIVEIEETNLKPTQIYGKFFASAWSTYFIHSSFNDRPIPIHESVLFIQILNTTKLKKAKEAKFQQFQTCSSLIKAFLPLANSPIRDYHLISGELNAIDQITGRLLSCISEFFANPG